MKIEDNLELQHKIHEKPTYPKTVESYDVEHLIQLLWTRGIKINLKESLRDVQYVAEFNGDEREATVPLRTEFLREDEVTTTGYRLLWDPSGYDPKNPTVAISLTNHKGGTYCSSGGIDCLLSVEGQAPFCDGNKLMEVYNTAKKILIECNRE